MPGGGSVKQFASDMDKTGAKTYRRLAGEVEARNTQARRRMDALFRRSFAPEVTADTPDSDVIVTFNGRDLVDGPLPRNTGRGLDEAGLKRVFDAAFPKLGKALAAMLERGRKGSRGGVVLIDSADPLHIAHAFAQKTGTGLSKAVELFSEDGQINGFFDTRSGLTFLIGPNLDETSAPAVLLHEMVHGQQREKLDTQAMDMLKNRGDVKDTDRRAFLDRVAARMIDAGETAGSHREAMAYIVEQAVLEGRSRGYEAADLRFLNWVDTHLGRTIGDVVRGFMRLARGWMMRHGVGLKTMSIDDLVEYAMAGVKRAAKGDVARPDGKPLPFSRAGFREATRRATAEINQTFSVPGKLSWWHKSIGTMYNLAERSPAFKPVFESAQGFIDDVSRHANEAADRAPAWLPKLDTWRDIVRKSVSAKDNAKVAKPLFEGTLLWRRDENGVAVPVQEGADGVNEAGIVWRDEELRSRFGLNTPQIALYREARAAINRSLDTMARTDMLRFGGDEVKALRDRVMDAQDVREAAAVLREHLIAKSMAVPERAARLTEIARGIMERTRKVAHLKASGYAPLSRFGRYTLDVVDNEGKRHYFSLFESKREANQMAGQLRAAFPEAQVEQGTLSEEAYKLFAGITPETLELFGNALGLESEGDSARDQVFQEYLRLTKTNRSALRRLIHRKGIAGYSEDVGRVLASFIYSNARQGSAALHVGDLNKAVDAIPQAQGELKDAAIGLADYIKNPQEEAQALRGLLFAQYLGGSIASALVNLTQTPGVTVPWLSQFGGARASARAIARAAREMATPGHEYETALAQALHEAEEDGIVSPQEVHQLMARAQGRGTLRAGDGTRLGDTRAAGLNALSRLAVGWGKLFSAAEQLNRRITFIAAYRLAKAQRMDNPAQFARRAVQQTQFVYSKASRMRWGRGPVGGNAAHL